MLTCAAVAAPLAAPAQVADTAMLGTWSGQARFDEPFTTQHELAVRVTISADGSVTGMVGDATLSGARFAPARGATGRALRIGREYSIDGALLGSLVKRDVVQRARVVISLDWSKGTFTGEVQTSGTHDGAPDTQAIVATGLVLHRTP